MNGLLLSLALSATPITLDQTREQASQNVQALLSELDHQRAVDRTRQARSGVLPQLGLNASASRALIGTSLQFTTVPVFDPVTGAPTGFEQTSVETPATARNDFALGLSLSQSIFDGARWANLSQASSQEQASKGQAFEQSLTSELEAIRRFYELYRTQRTLDVLEKTVARSQEQVERAEAMFQAGRAVKSELLAAQVNLGNDRINVTQQRARIAVAQTELATWLAHPGSEELLAQDPGTLGPNPAPPPALEAAIEKAKAQRPVLRALEDQVRAANAAALAAKSGYLPRLSFAANYQRAGPRVDPVFTDVTKNNTVFGSLDLRWDLFSGFNTSAQVSEALAARSQAELSRAQAERDLEAEVTRAHRVLVAQIESALIARSNREIAASGLSLSEERFKAGVGSTLEVRDAQLKLTQAELSLLTSRIDVEIARASLSRAMGESRPGAQQ